IVGSINVPPITRSPGNRFQPRNNAAPAVDEFRPVTIISGRHRFPPKAPHSPARWFDHGDRRMISPEPIARAQSRLRFLAGAVAALALCVLAAGVPGTLHAQVSEGVQKGAREGTK